MSDLFNVPPQVKPNSTKFCRTCLYRQRWECGNSVIQYCSKRKSNRTFNGLLKIKVTNPACSFYEDDVVWVNNEIKRK
ncbi:hypothetical protein SAMN05216383_12043 [Prevotella sp. KH2C16]|nr:hypothetical protein SAMN05216383_12043 [Prevotella sp. KH2C16]